MSDYEQENPPLNVARDQAAEVEVTPERWQQIKEVFGAALERKPGERRAFLQDACGVDELLRAEVESLLAEEQSASTSVASTAAAPDMPPSEVHSATDPMIGRRIGAYRIIHKIGYGGMAAVYLTMRADDVYQKQVAIKLVMPGLDHQEILRRFRTERQTLASLDHPNIVKLLDGGTTEEGLPYLVMDYVEGVPIDEYCDQHKQSTTGRLQLFRVVCAAVQYAHENQVIHRDLKPSNILVTAAGIPKLLDFGIAKVLNPDIASRTLQLTQSGMRALTPAYASPEQVRGEPVTPASDVYALGVVLYELLTGHRPYQLKRRTPLEIEQAICETDPEKPSTVVSRVETETSPDGTTNATITPELVSRTREGEPEKLRRRLRGDLDNIVLTALHKEPQRRYASVEELSFDIGRHLEHRPVRARKSTLAYRSSKFVRRHKVEVVAAAVMLLLVIGGILLARWEVRRTAEGARGEWQSQNIRVTRLTESGKAGQATISPDGRYIVYSQVDGEQQSLRFRNVSTKSDVQVLAPDALNIVGLTFSSDGDFIYFVRSRKGSEAIADLYRIPVFGGAEQKLLETIDSRISFSPDGKQFAFIRGVPPSSLEIHIANADGRADRIAGVFQAFLQFINGVAWSPDGKSILVPTLRGPKGKKFLLTSLSLDGTKHEILSSDDFIGVPAWMPDGRSILVPTQQGVRRDLEGANATQIWTLSFADQQFSRMTHDLTNYGPSLDITRDGRTLVAVERRQTAQIWEVPGGDARKARQLTTSEILYSGVTPGPNGKLLLRRQSGDMERLKADGGQPVPFLPNFQNFISLSSCGDRYVVFDNHKASTIDLWRADADGSHPMKLAEEVLGSDCSPDGKWVLYQSGNGLYRMSVEGGPPARVVSFSNATLGRGEISPDGEWIAYLDLENAPKAEVTLAIIRASGGKPLETFTVPYDEAGLGWAPDGKGLQYVLTRKGVTNVWEQKRTGGQPQQVTNFAEGQIFDFSWTRDGRTLLVVRGDITQDVVMVTVVHDSSN